MCLIVYLGVDHKINEFTDIKVGGLGLNPSPSSKPLSLENKKFVYEVADLTPSGWNCSCILQDYYAEIEERPEKAEPDYPEMVNTSTAYQMLKYILESACQSGANPVLFSCWDGNQMLEPEVVRSLSPNDFQTGQGLFDNIRDDGGGLNPPILINVGGGA